MAFQLEVSLTSEYFDSSLILNQHDRVVYCNYQRFLNPKTVDMMLTDLVKQSVLVLLLVFVRFGSALPGHFNATAPSIDAGPSPNVVQSLLYLVIPVMIVLSIMTVAARKAYLACSPRLNATQDKDAPKQRAVDEFCTSIDTTDSIDDITFADVKADSASWNPFKKYSNVAKAEAVTAEDGDEELGMKSKVQVTFTTFYCILARTYSTSCVFVCVTEIECTSTFEHNCLHV